MTKEREHAQLHIFLCLFIVREWPIIFSKGTQAKDNGRDIEYDRQM